jgi:hypothetical protein
MWAFLKTVLKRILRCKKDSLLLLLLLFYWRNAGGGVKHFLFLKVKNTRKKNLFESRL